jgi:hypothetical protein
VFDASPLTDEELTALALAADPNAPIADDATVITGISAVSTLPSWYMPAIALRRSGRWQRAVICTVVAAFLIIEAFGLCSTYG